MSRKLQFQFFFTAVFTTTFFCAGLLSAQAQTADVHKISGIVLDQTSKEPLAFAALSIKGYARGTTTDFDGKFEYEILETYFKDTLVVSMLGYEMYQVPIQKLLRANRYTFHLSTTAFDLVTAEVGSSYILKNIFFEFNKHELLPTSEPELNKVFDFLTKKPNVNAQLIGHTDSIGSQAYNLALSEARASAVVAWLEEKGISQNRLKAKGFGELQPIAPNSTEAGRQQNRRVEMHIIKAENPPPPPIPQTPKPEPKPEPQPTNRDALGQEVDVTFLPRDYDSPSTDAAKTPINPSSLFPKSPVSKLPRAPVEQPDTAANTPKAAPSIKADTIAQVPPPSPSFFEQVAQDSNFVGVLMVQRTVGTYQEAARGFADIGWEKPNDLDTKFFIGSVTEQMTAYIILQLVGEGKLTLDGTVSAYSSLYTNAAWTKRVTIRQLLSHTSGMGREVASPTHLLDEITLTDTDTFFHNKLNYNILVECAQTATKLPWDEVVLRYIGQPFAMTDTKPFREAVIYRNMAGAYRFDAQYWNIVPAPSDDVLVAGANDIVSTLADLRKWQNVWKKNALFAQTFRSFLPAALPSPSNYWGGLSGAKTAPSPVVTWCRVNGHTALVVQSADEVAVLLSNVQHEGFYKRLQTYLVASY